MRLLCGMPFARCTATERFPVDLGDTSPNPFVRLLKKMGLKPEQISTYLGLTPGAVKKIFSDPPAKGHAISSICRIFERMHIRMFVEMTAKPLTIWFPTPRVDRLFYTTKFRENVCNLAKLPRDREQIVRLIKQRSRGGVKPSIVADYLNRNFIPQRKAGGYGYWTAKSVRRSTWRIREGEKIRGNAGRMPDAWKEPWRKLVASSAIAHIFPASPQWSLDYGLISDIGDDFVMIRATKPMPLCMYEWLLFSAREFANLWIVDFYIGLGDDRPELPTLIAPTSDKRIGLRMANHFGGYSRGRSDRAALRSASPKSFHLSGAG